MSIWSTIGGIAAGIGTGLITGNPAAGIAVAGSIIGSGTQSSQVSKAADKQQQGTDQANQVASSTYADTRRNLDPYIQLGGGAIGNLRGLTGMTPATPYNDPGATNTPGMAKGAQATVPTDLNLHGFNLTSFPRDQDPGAVASAQSQSGYVAMQGPDGSVRNVPTGHVDYWEANGATRV